MKGLEKSMTRSRIDDMVNGAMARSASCKSAECSCARGISKKFPKISNRNCDLYTINIFLSEKSHGTLIFEK